jgi:deoxycytidylate deaminase
MNFSFSLTPCENCGKLFISFDFETVFFQDSTQAEQYFELSKHNQANCLCKNCVEPYFVMKTGKQGKTHENFVE